MAGCTFLHPRGGVFPQNACYSAGRGGTGTSMCHTPNYILLLVVSSSSFLFITALSLSRNGRNQSRNGMVGGGRLVQEFGGRRRRLGGGFRLGVGVKSLVGSASAWSVKGGFLLLPATRERKKSSLFSRTGEQKRLLSTTLFFTIDVFCPYLGFLLRLLTFASVYFITNLPPLLRSRGV